MVLCALWADYYLHSWIKTPNLDHQTLMTIISINAIYVPNLDKTTTKQNFTCDIYKSMYVEV